MPIPDQKNKPAQPRNQHIFDPWNSSSTGHQRAENPYSRTTEWRDTRREKLARQFRSEVPSRDSLGGSYTAGNEARREEGEWKWMSAQEATRNELGVADIRRYMGGVSKVQPPPTQVQSHQKSEQQRQPTMKEKLAYEPADPTTISPTDPPNPLSETHDNNKDSSVKQGEGIFTHLTFYINGSTYPTISDHKLKHLLAEEGGNVSLYLARKSVTHVILGSTTAAAGSGGRKSGGLLSAGKMQKEVLSKASGFGKGVKYVNVEWVIESIKAGKKLPEARFSPSSSTRGNNGLDRYKSTGNGGGGGVGVPVGQKSVYDMFNKSTTSTTRNNKDVG